MAASIVLPVPNKYAF